jgi:pimeloyl-ACP methyl ester carboxylesterase
MNLFLLRGLVREKEHWGEFVDKVKAAFPQANIILPEIQGVGEFYQQTSANTLEDMVEFMRKNHKDQIEDENQNVLFAMSLGGMLARCWMDLYSEDFHKVILVNTSFRGLSPVYRRLRPMALFSFLRLFLTIDLALRELGILELVSNSPKQVLTTMLPHWLEIQKKRPVSRKSFVNQIQAALKYRPPLDKPNAEILILAGAGDRLAHCQCSVDVLKAWGGKLVIHPYSGHDLPIDASEWLIKELKDWGLS